MFTDNWYSGGDLLDLLLEKKIHTIGTLRKNRGTSVSFEEKLNSLSKNDSFTEKDGNRIYTGVHDNKLFRVISSFEQQGVIQKETWVKEKNPLSDGKKFIFNKATKEIPRIVDSYNHGMGGVDKCDQLLKYYSTGRKTKKWSIKALFGCLIFAY